MGCEMSSLAPTPGKERIQSIVDREVFDDTTIRPLLEALEEHVVLLKLLGEAGTGGTVTVRIGGEGPYQELSSTSVVATGYGREKISERHRHRYEFNNNYRAEFSARGLVLSGLSPDSTLVEIIELRGHPWFLGCQFHPEFKSRPMDGHPLFRGFVQASLARR